MSTFDLVTKSLLQWGRNFFVTEMFLKKSKKMSNFKLQWGRNFFVTEICITLGYNELKSASMGP